MSLPFHLQRLAGTGPEITLNLTGGCTQRRLLDTIEEQLPSLRGAIRDRTTGRRRPLVRFFACGEDLSHDDPETPLPPAVMDGSEPFVILGAIAGG